MPLAWRQRCRTDAEAMLEDLLAEANRQKSDRSMILRAFEDAAPEQAKEAHRASFERINKRAA